MSIAQIINPQGTGRLSNRRNLLAQLRAGGAAGRADLARALGLSVQAVSNLTDELAQAGLIRAVGRRAGGRGLPVTLYDLNPDGAFALGFEIRPSRLYGSVTDLSGRGRGHESHELTDSCPDTVVPQIQAMAARLCATLTKDPLMIGAGIVRPGPFGKTGLHQPRTELLGWDDPQVVSRIEDALAMPVSMDHDASAGASAEHQIGCAQGLRDFAYLYFGTGLGLGVIAGGVPLQGAHGNSGEIGHLHLPGLTGVLEDHLSRSALARHLAAGGIHANSVDDIAAHFDAHTPALLGWIAATAPVLGAAVALIENLFDPATIVLGGAMPPSVLEALIAACPLPVRSVANRPGRSLPRLQCGTCGPYTVSTGAAALMRNQFFTHPM